MIVEKKSEKIFVKTLSPIEAYFLNILKRFFEAEHSNSTNNIEYIINEAVIRCKEEITLDSGKVLSVNKMRGHVVLDAASVGAEPVFKKNTAFNKNFGDGSGTICEGNDPRLDHSDYYNKTEIENLIKDIKKLSAGIKIIVTKKEWINHDDIYKVTINHNLNLNIESFNVAFYKNKESVCFDYKILSNNSFEVYSDEICDLDVVLRQALVCTVAIPTDIRNQIDKNTLDVGKNIISIKEINSELTIIKESLNGLSVDFVDLIDAVNELKKITKTNSDNIKTIFNNLSEKANKNHRHSMSDITYDRKDLLLKDFGSLSNLREKVQVSLAKGTESELSTYKGVLGELVVDTTNKRIVLQDGEKFGGIIIPNINHSHDFNDLTNIPPEKDLSNYYQKSETYSKEEIEEAIRNIPNQSLENYYNKSEIDETVSSIINMTGAEPPTDTSGGNLMWMVGDNRDRIELLENKFSYVYNVAKEELVLNNDTGFYEVIVNHNLNTNRLSISIFINNEKNYAPYSFIDENNILIESSKLTGFTIELNYKNKVFVPPIVPEEGGEAI